MYIQSKIKKRKRKKERMAQEDPEKRFHSIMDKLFHSPKSNPSSSSSSSMGLGAGGNKRPNPSSALALQEPAHFLVGGQPPLCRPWDRGDLLRRLSTFKSMTWFAKPKVVSAVNCARRGWVNVDMDIIACESCGARLFFSTPPYWTPQQVEKAALVFSLKLDSGHNLLCPWIDNACDERLAEFPPTMPADLVDQFRKRSYLLFQFLALPVISSSAIEFMTSPQLEEFLRQPLMLDSQKGNAEFSQLQTIEAGPHVDSANLYYQAQKLISLCGWEPRSLPYVVDSKDDLNRFVKDADILNSSQGVDSGRNLSLSFHATDEIENLEAHKNFENSCRLQYDPKSVVLDCRLCGASVGLWAFSTVQRPVELHDSGHESNHDDMVVSVASIGESSSMEQSSNLKLTIAGGPLPAQQNFKATISLPVIGQSLRARLSCHPEFRDQIHNNQEDIQVESQCNGIQGEIGCFNNNVSGQIVPLEDMRTLNSKKDDQVNCNSTSNDRSPCSNHDVSATDDISRNLMLLEGTCFTAEEISPHTSTYDSNMGGQIESLKNVVQAGKDSGTLHVGESSVTSQVANISPRNAGTKDNDSSVMITSEKCHPEQIAETDKMNSREDKTCSDAPNANSEEGVIAGVQTAGNNKVFASSKGKDLKQLHMDKMSEFDPIMQHRHFCPWIASTGSRIPGWQQTLSALLCRKDFPHSLPTCSPSSASMIMVDDPIASVRNLFMSPTAKKMKTTRESS
ncbi:hypothetical protein REPUB_Repub07fG0003000 [Reevesia pubescens]